MDMPSSEKSFAGISHNLEQAEGSDAVAKPKWTGDIRCSFWLYCPFMSFYQPL